MGWHNQRENHLAFVEERKGDTRSGTALKSMAVDTVLPCRKYRSRSW
jgi:hypothetical protein